MIHFTSSSSPSRIDIQHFHSKAIAFFEVGEYDGDYQYFYFGDTSEVWERLPAMGFQDLKILGELPDEDGYFLVKRK